MWLFQSGNAALFLAVTLLVQVGLQLPVMAGPTSQNKKPAVEDSAVVADQQAKKALTMAIEVFRSDGLGALTEVRNGLRNASTAGVNADVVAKQAAVAFHGVRKFKYALEVAANLQTPNTTDLFIMTLFSYFTLRDPLYRAVEVFKDKIGFSHQDVLDLDLILPSQVAIQFIQEDSLSSGNLGLGRFNLMFNSTDAGKGKKRLSLSGDNLRALGVASLIDFPSKDLTKRLLDFEALKILFTEHAGLASYLYADEKTDVSAESVKVEPAIKSMQADAESIVQESLVRRGLTRHLLQEVSDAIEKTRDNQAFDVLPMLVFVRISRDFAGVINQQKFKEFDYNPLNVLLTYQAEEKKKRTEALYIAFKNVGQKLTELGEDSLREAALSAILEAERNIVYSILNQAFFDMESIDAQLTPAELNELNRWISIAVTNSFEPNEVVDTFVKVFRRARAERDVSVSIGRYQLVEKLLVAIQSLEKIEAKIDKVENQDELPLSIIPKDPNPGEVLRALKPNAQIPEWLNEMMLLLGGALENQKSITNIASLRDAVLQVPGYLSTSISKINDTLEIGSHTLATTMFGQSFLGIIGKAHALPECPNWIPKCEIDLISIAPNPVLSEIQALHGEKLKTPGYEWMPLESQLKELHAAAQGEAAKEVLKKLVLLSWTAKDVLKSKSLMAMVERSFRDLLLSRSEGLDQLAKEAKKAAVFVRGNTDFIRSVFAPEVTRNNYLRSLLVKAPVLKRYYEFGAYETLNMFPILNTPLLIPVIKEGQPIESLSTRKITLVDLIKAIRFSIKGFGPGSAERFVRELEKQVGSGKKFTNEYLASKVSEEMPMRVLLDSAFRNSEKLISPSKTAPRLAHDFLCVFYKGFSSFDECPEFDAAAVTIPQFWPQSLKVRDVLPVMADKESSYQHRLLKMALSSVVGAYLRSAQIGNENFTEILMDPNSNESEKILQTRVYNEFLKKVKPVAGGVERYKKEILHWRETLEWMKEKSVFLQEINHYAFWASSMTPPTAVGMHFAQTIAMITATSYDLGVDLVTFAQRWSTFVDLQIASNTGAVDAGLLSYADLNDLRQDVINRMYGLYDRLPMDMIFMTGFATNVYRSSKSSRANKKALQAFESWNVKDIQRFEVDIDRLKVAMEVLDVTLNAKNFNQIEKIVNQKMKERPAGWMKDAASKEQFGQMGLAGVMREITLFKRKYPGFVTALRQYGDVGISSGKRADAKAEKEKLELATEEAKNRIEVPGAYKYFGLTPDAPFETVKSKYETLKNNLVGMIEPFEKDYPLAKGELWLMKNQRKNEKNLARWKNEFNKEKEAENKKAGKEVITDKVFDQFMTNRERALESQIKNHESNLKELAQVEKRFERIRATQPKSDFEKKLASEAFDRKEHVNAAKKLEEAKKAAPAAAELLGVKLSTPMAEVKKAYRSLMREAHPDKLMLKFEAEHGRKPTAEELEEMRMIGVKLNSAFEALTKYHEDLAKNNPSPSDTAPAKTGNEGSKPAPTEEAPKLLPPDAGPSH